MVQSSSKNLPENLESGTFYRVQGNVPSWIKPTSQNLMFMFNDKPISTAKLPQKSSVSAPIYIKILAKTVEEDTASEDVSSLLSKFWSFTFTAKFKNYNETKKINAKHCIHFAGD